MPAAIIADSHLSFALLQRCMPGLLKHLGEMMSTTMMRVQLEVLIEQILRQRPGSSDEG